MFPYSSWYCKPAVDTSLGGNFQCSYMAFEQRKRTKNKEKEGRKRTKKKKEEKEQRKRNRY